MTTDRHDNYRVYWGDTHHHTYHDPNPKTAVADILAFAGTHMDFYGGAYYTGVSSTIPLTNGLEVPTDEPEDGHPHESLAANTISWKGPFVESLKSPELLLKEWKDFQGITAACNRPGEFVVFPGYEWQGNGRCGDHNVLHKQEGQPIDVPQTLTELYSCLKGREAIAIPHHTAYRVGFRAPTWAACNESISPYAEVFSVHGCSETDEEWIGLRQNSYMGPGVSGGTYQEALDQGLHLGAICSTDNSTGMPGYWGHGLMACLARQLTRQSLWEAFLARRVYGVTGDRIELDFTCNGAVMGSILEPSAARKIRVAVCGADAIDRIEILRNGRVIATHCHQGSWDHVPAGASSRYKLRIEMGWGPGAGTIPVGSRRWEGQLSIQGGRILGWEPCWISRDQRVLRCDSEKLQFSMLSRQEYVSRESQGAIICEFEATPEATLILRLNGQEIRNSVGAFAAGSHLLGYADELIERFQKVTGLTPKEVPRSDALYYVYSHKAKLHRAIPAAGYTAIFEITDDEPLQTETHYRVRVEQRNGQRAWSSPIWIRKNSRER